jgi:hypothetical protein
VRRSVTAPARRAFDANDLLDLASVAVTATLAVAVLTKDESAVRAIAALFFTLFVPGRAVVSNWPAIATRSPVAVSVLFSLVLLTLFATLTLWLRFWHPLGLLEVESIISIIALLVGILRRHRPPVAPTEILQSNEQAR